MEKFVNKLRQLISIKFLSFFGYFYTILLFFINFIIINHHNMDSQWNILSAVLISLFIGIFIMIITIILIISGCIEYKLKIKKNLIEMEKKFETKSYIFIAGLIINIIFSIIWLYLFTVVIILKL